MGMEEIRQDSQVRLSAEKGDYLEMIFFNLTGRNFKNEKDYRLSPVCVGGESGLASRTYRVLERWKVDQEGYDC